MGDGSGCLYALAILWIVLGGSAMVTGKGGGLIGISLLALGIGLLVWMQSEKKKAAERASTSQKSTYSNSTTSSAWEDRVAKMVEEEAYGYTVLRNDRSVIPGRDGGGNLEIDMYIPSLKLGFEANGEHWHDHSAYRRDIQNGTSYSTERYKEKWCADHDIKLVHLWDSQPDYQIRREIESAISSQKWR